LDRGNKLWESHRIYLPKMRDKLIPCRECVFLVDVIGREETRTGCVVSIKEYGTLRKRGLPSIHSLELLRRVGKEGLKEIIERGANPEAMACCLYRPKLSPKK
jgi:hypothetical protein